MMKWIPRQVWRTPVCLAVVDLNGQAVTDAYLLDVSPLGAMMEAACVLVPDEVVWFRFRLPQEEETARLDARVVWVKEDAAGVGRHRSGLCFLKPNWWLPAACGKTSPLEALSGTPEWVRTLVAHHLQILERVTAMVGRMAAEVQALRVEVAELRAEVRGSSPEPI